MGSYLKTKILPILVRQNLAEKFHTTRTLSHDQLTDRFKVLTKGKKTTASAVPAASHSSTTSVWLWRPMDPAKVPAARLAVEKEKKPLYGWEVGFGEDASHLNKRRQRKRVEKVRSDVAWMKALEKERSEGQREAAHHS